MQGLIHIPISAQEFRKIHQSGGDYLHRGEVLATGPGDRMVRLHCDRCCLIGEENDKCFSVRLSTAKNFRCGRCSGTTTLLRDGPLNAEMPVNVGDIVLYENRRDAKLHPGRFPSLGLEDDTLVILLAEQHVMAVLEESE